MEEKPPNGKAQNINRAFFESYDQVHIQMPEHGLDFKCKPLLVKDAARFLRLMMKAQGDNEKERGFAMLELLEEFPKAVEAEEEMAMLLPGEVFDLVGYFFTLSRSNLKKTNGHAPADSLPEMGESQS